VNQSRFHGLQVLRVIAAVMIVAYHTGTLASGVFGLNTPLVRFLTQPFFGSGVFLFFALSGFVIAHSLRNASPGRFLLMRAARLYPGYWLAAGLTVAVFWIVWRIVPVISWKRFTFGLTLLPSTDPSRFVLYVEWSLVYEVLFYLVFGFLAFGGQRAIKVGGLLWLTACVVKLVFSNGDEAPPFPGWAGISFSSFNIFFLAGCCAYWLRDCGKRLRPWSPLAWPVLIGVQYITHDHTIVYLCLSVGWASVVWYMAGAARWTSDHRLVRWGDVTYGIYLVHMPALFVLDCLAHDGPTPLILDSLVVCSGVCALAIGSAFGKLESAIYRSIRARLKAPACPAPAMHAPLRGAA
jgi:peptidoglycan/LPS O-acetylase OafA/YrhL